MIIFLEAGMGFSMAAVDGGGLAAEKSGGGNWRVTAGEDFCNGQFCPKPNCHCNQGVCSCP